MTVSDRDANCYRVSSACSWYVLEVPDGNYNVAAVQAALEHSRNHVGQPIFINITTVIGIGTSLAGTAKAHHAAFGQADIEKCKQLWGFDLTQTHFVPEDVREDWSHIRIKGEKLMTEWEDLLQRYAHMYPELAKEFHKRSCGKFDPKWKQALRDFQVEKKNLPTRQSSAQVYDMLYERLPLFAGSADLSEPNFTLRVAKKAFGVPRSDAENLSFTGRYVHYGAREFGMIAIANGIAAFARKAFIPITATFAMFQLYGGAAIRMSALNKLQVIHIGTHDSIAEGACGPTHQVCDS